MGKLEIQQDLFSTFMDSQYWPREELERYQQRRLERLLRHARNHVPFYKDRLAPIIDDRDVVDLSRWSEIPLLTRRDLMEHGPELRSQALPQGHGAVGRTTTSGSTGDPLTVFVSEYAGATAGAAALRAQSWHELDWSRDVLFWTEERKTGVWPNVERGSIWGPRWLAQSTGRRLRFNGDTPGEHILNYIREHDIRYLSCRAKVAQVLALQSERLGLKAELDAVLAFSTGVQDDEREDIERIFGAKVLSLYSSKEESLMAYECTVGHHLHVAEERLLLELLDDEGRTVPRGTVGRVVVTGLFNWAQPLIRYVHGDLAIEGEACSCGRTLRVLDRVVGRVTDMFRFPDGSAVAFALPENTKRELNIKTWQVAQIAPLLLEVRYQPIVARVTDEVAIAAAVQARTHPQVVVRVRKTDSFLPKDGRKFAEYVNEIR